MVVFMVYGPMWFSGGVAACIVIMTLAWGARSLMQWHKRSAKHEVQRTISGVFVRFLFKTHAP